MKKRVLIFNFFGGMMSRGIPLYVENLAVALRDAGLLVHEIRCPRLLRRAPRPLINMLFVVTEQIVMPLLSLATFKTLYPYNSVSFLAGVIPGSALVVHDFVHLEQSKTSLAAWYIRMTQNLYARSHGDVVYVSRSTQASGERLLRFPHSKSYLLPNTFYLFVTSRSIRPPARAADVLLCTGWGKNKDLSGALLLYLESGLYMRRRLRILGLAGHADAVHAFCREHAKIADALTVLPHLDQQDLVNEYESAAWVWVHSLCEGFGRPLAEARLCGCRLIASDIPPFREQRDTFTFLYSNLQEFKHAVDACESAPPSPERRDHYEDPLLRAELARFIYGSEGVK